VYERTNSIEPERLPEKVTNYNPYRVAEAMEFPEEGINLTAHLDQLEKTYVLEALRRTAGNQTNAAELLRLSVRSLRHIIDKHGARGLTAQMRDERRGPDSVPRRRATDQGPRRRSEDSGEFAAGLEDNTVRTWSVATGSLLRTMPTGIGGTPVLAFSPDGRLLTATNEDTDVRVFQVKEGELRRRVSLIDKTGHTVAVLGANDVAEDANNNRTEPSRWKSGIVTAPHGVAFTGGGDLLISEFNLFGRVHRFTAAPTDR